MKIIENEGSKLKMEIADVTFVNLLNEVLWEQKGVDISSYAIPHPYMASPILLVKSKNPKKSVEDAVESISKEVEGLRKQAEKELK